MLHDIVIAGRTLLKRPGYSFSIVLTLGLGITAATVMFSLFDASILRPLPFKQSDRLIFLLGVAGPDRSPRGGSIPEVLDWRSLNRTLEDVSIYDETSLNLQLGTEALRVETEMVSASYFPLLGVNAARGRTFLPEEDAVLDRNPVAVISHAMWTQRFGGASDILDRTIVLNDRPLKIVGVMPENFAGVSFDTDVWVPAMMVSLTSAPGVAADRGTRWLGAIGRLRDGASLATAQQDLDRVAALLERDHPQFNRERGVQLSTLRDGLLGNTRTLVMALFMSVLLFLAVASANVASLQLVRAAGQRREVAVRFALGARQWHVVRQLLTESVLLALVAGALGLLVADWALGAVLSFTPQGALPRYVRLSLDPRAALFALVVALLSGAAIAILPAMAATRRDLSDALKTGMRSAGRGLGSLRRPSLQHSLVIVEIALAVTLLTAAGLMVRSLERQLNVPIGFNPDAVTVSRASLPGGRYRPDAQKVFVERAVERLREIPGVTSAAIATSLPFTGNASAGRMLPDHATEPSQQLRYFRTFVTPSFFDTLRIPIKHGRAFTSSDRIGAPAVAIINESGAKRIWGSSIAIGRRFRAGASDPIEIVGVAADARFRSLRTDFALQAEPEIYFPFAQRSDRDIEFAVRTDGATVPLAALREAIASIDQGLPLYAVQPLEEAVRQQTATGRFGSSLLTIFSMGTLLLAAIGLYGLVAYVVGLSRQEIAIRLALGADSWRVVTLIVRNGMTLVIAGILLGLGGALLAGQSLETQLFQTRAADPATLASVALLLGFVALVASLIPTYRAAKVAPHSALRAE